MPALSPDGLTIEHLASWQGLMDHYDVAASPAIADGDVLAWDAGQGMFVATPMGGFSGGATVLDDLTDVTITAAAVNQTLRYDGAAWVNTSVLLTTTTGVSVGGFLSVNPGITLDRSGAEPYILFSVSTVNKAQVRGYDAGVKITNETAGTTWLDVNASGVSVPNGTFAVGTTPQADRGAHIAFSDAVDAYNYALVAISTKTGATTGGAGPVGGYFRADVNAPALTVDWARGVYIATPTVTAGTLTTAIGLYIAPITTGGTNYAIYTGLGLVRFGDNTTVGTGTTGISSHLSSRQAGTASYISARKDSGGSTEIFMGVDAGTNAMLGTWTSQGIEFRTLNTARWTLTAAGHLTATDNTYDLGASGATRPRTGYFGTSVVIATDPTGSEALRVGGGARFTAQVVSTLATGTAPFSIASTTLVTNLNADLLDGQHASAFVSTSSANTFTAEQSFSNLAALMTWYGDASARLKLSYNTTANAWEWSVLDEAGLDPITLAIGSADGVWDFTSNLLKMNGTIVSVVGHVHAAGDITSGTLSVTRGGTGVSDPTSGNLLVGAGASAMTALAPGAAGGFVRSSGAAWVRSTIQVSDIPSHVHSGADITSGTVDETVGGTGNTTYTAGDTLYALNSTTLQRLGIGGTGTFYKSTGSAPSWASITAADVGAGTFPGTGAYTFTGPVRTPASVAGNSGLRIPHGTAPTSPTNGDIWTTTAGVFVRINGATVQLGTTTGSVLLAPSGAQYIDAGSQTSANYPLALRAADADGTTTNVDSPPYQLIASYWDGASPVDSTWTIFGDMIGAPGDPFNTLTFKHDSTNRMELTSVGRLWLTGPVFVGSDNTPPVTAGTQELVAHDNTRQIGIGVDTTRGLIGMRSNHEFSFMVNNTRYWTVTTTAFAPVTDVQVDIGTSSLRVREIFTQDLRVGVAVGTAVGLIYHSGEFDNSTSGAGAKTIDWTKGNVQKITATGAATISFTAPDGPTTLVLRIISNSTTGYTFTWPATVKWAGGVSAPTSPTTSGKWIMATFYYDGTNYTGSYTGDTG